MGKALLFLSLFNPTPPYTYLAYENHKQVLEQRLDCVERRIEELEEKLRIIRLNQHFRSIKRD